MHVYRCVFHSGEVRIRQTGFGQMVTGESGFSCTELILKMQSVVCGCES